MNIETSAKRAIGTTFPRLVVAPSTGCIVLALDDQAGIILRKSDKGTALPIGASTNITIGEWTDYLGVVTLSNDG